VLVFYIDDGEFGVGGLVVWWVCEGYNIYYVVFLVC